jgi:hypothetical protein
MEAVNVVVAALAAFVFGAVWYSLLSKPWIAASGIATDASGKPVNASSPAPFVVGGIAMVVTAVMMRHVFGIGGIDTVTEAIVAGGGLGAFLVVPWIAMNYAFANRPGTLWVIDSVNAIVGCAIMGVVLVLF